MCWNNVPISLRRRARHGNAATLARAIEIGYESVAPAQRRRRVDHRLSPRNDLDDMEQTMPKD